MILTTYFNDFLKEIRLTQNQIDDLIQGHTTLRKRLNDDETLSKIIVSTFLQGSYRRSTAIKPKNGTRSDVDIVVVTKLSMDEYTPEQALNVFVPFLEKHYKGKYRIQGRSIGISLSYVDMDIVPTAAPSESEEGILESFGRISQYDIADIGNRSFIEKLASSQRYDYNLVKSFFDEKEEEEWKSSPLYIPDREAKEWKPTHPIAQIQWTFDKNSKCNGHYINIVKALKWWRRVNYPDAGQPKSYPLEHFIGQCCPDDITSVAEGVTLVLEGIANNYPEKPVLPDHGVPEHDVFARVTEDEYDLFYDNVRDAAITARKALDSEDLAESAEEWKKLFGKEFPNPPESAKNNRNTGDFSVRTQKSTDFGEGRFA